MLQLSANGRCEEFYIFLSKVLADNRGTGCMQIGYKNFALAKKVYGLHLKNNLSHKTQVWRIKHTCVRLELNSTT